MRQQKIRGHNRLQKQIEPWRIDNLTLNLDYVKNNERGHIDIIIHPWCDISIINSAFIEPKRKTKEKILSGLLDIYDSWKIQLDNLGQPYYLKIWLFEPRFSNSQVVCAIGDSVDYYKNTFYKADKSKSLNSKNYSKLQDRISKLHWDCRLDEDTYDNTAVGDREHYATAKSFEESKLWFNNLLKRPHRKEKLNEKIGDIDELYFFKRGHVWIGGQE